MNLNNNTINRRFSVAPMMECSIYQRICLFFNFLGGSPLVCIVLFIVPLLRRKRTLVETVLASPAARGGY
jgi:hypothetical protein